MEKLSKNIPFLCAQSWKTSGEHRSVKDERRRVVTIDVWREKGALAGLASGLLDEPWRNGIAVLGKLMDSYRRTVVRALRGRGRHLTS